LLLALADHFNRLLDPPSPSFTMSTTNIISKRRK